MFNAFFFNVTSDLKMTGNRDVREILLRANLAESINPDQSCPDPKLKPSSDLSDSEE